MPIPNARTATALPTVASREEFEAHLADLRRREKDHTRAGDALAAERRRLPMVQVDGSLPLDGPNGSTTLLNAFEGRRQLLAYFFMWKQGEPFERQCEGCTFYNNQVSELSYLHSRDITYAVFAQGPFAESLAYRDFMRWTMPWYSALPSHRELFGDRPLGLFHLISYLRDGDDVYETYWTTGRGVEAMDNNYALMDLTPYGRQEEWEPSPQGWPQPWRVDPASLRTGSRPTAQWARVGAAPDDDAPPTHSCCH